jgi:hypothetical protein
MLTSARWCDIHFDNEGDPDIVWLIHIMPPLRLPLCGNFNPKERAYTSPVWYTP